MIFYNKKQCTILGSGFGLYGYLPAAVNCGYYVLLPYRYKSIFDGRKELLRYKDSVSFVEKEEEAVKASSLCIVARRPEDQYRLIQQLISFNSLERLILEKPIAPNPKMAWELYKILHESNKNIRVGYSFFYTEWGVQAHKFLKQNSSTLIKIEWTFMAHHFQHEIDSWKRHTDSGGGALRFYGIQLIGILAVANEWTILNSVLYCTNKEEAIRWEALIVCKEDCLVNICVDSKSKNRKFTCQVQTKDNKDIYLYENESPFTASKDDQDCRIGVLEKIIETDSNKDMFIKQSIKLWDLIEKNSKVIMI